MSDLAEADEMAFIGKPVRQQTFGDGAQSKFKQDISHFEQSLKEMQTCMKVLNETVAEHYSESPPRTQEFQRALQDENTLVDNFIKDIHDVEDRLRRYSHKYDDAEGDTSALASANRSSEFNTSVLEAMFRGQNVFFAESLKVSQVLMDIVSQTKHKPSAREVILTCELHEKLGHRKSLGPTQKLGTGGPPAAMAVSPFTPHAGGHRGPGTMISGAYGSKPPQTKGPSMQVKPASRFSTPPSSTSTGSNRLYISI